MTMLSNDDATHFTIEKSLMVQAEVGSPVVLRSSRMGVQVGTNSPHKFVPLLQNATFVLTDS